MTQRLDKYYYKIGKYATLFMVMTVVVFLLGPINWIDQWNVYSVIGIVLLCIYITMFMLGFLSNKRKQLNTKYKNSLPIRERNKDMVMKLLKYSLWITCLIVVWNALEYSGSSSLSALVNNALHGVSNPADVYYTKDVSSRSGSLITYVNLLFQPLVYLTLVSGLYHFKLLKKYQRVLYIFIVLVEVMRWLAVGTNKGLFDVIFIFLSVYVLKLADKDRKMSKKKKRIVFIAICIAGILFFAFFGSAMNDRVGGTYNYQNFEDFPYNIVPENQRVLVEKVDSYLTQGYSNMFQCLEHCEFRWTYGVGNSRFLTSVIERIFDVDIFSRTYPAQLSFYGIDGLASWHSAYTWFASDIGFLGIIFLMFWVGRYFSSVLQDSILYHDSLSITIFYFLMLAIANSSCTNYILAYVNMWSGVVILSIIRWIRKKKIRIVFSR